MSRAKDVSAIAIVVALAAGTDTVFGGVGTSATARDTVVDGRLIRRDIVRDTCSAPAPMTHLVCIEPQDRSSGKLIFGSVFHSVRFLSVLCVRCAQKCPVLGTGLRG